MSGLPLQVEKAGKRSEDLMKQHAEGKGPGKAPDKPQDPQPTVEDLTKKLTDLQSKFDVLQGKYNKEIKDADPKDLQRLVSENSNLRKQNRDLQQAMQANQDLVKEVRAELEKSKSTAAEAPIDLNQILSEEDRAHLDSEDLGGKTLEILLKLVKAAGGSELAGEIKKLSTQVENTTKRIDETEKRVNRTEETTTQISLESVVPDINTINADPRFHKWLDDTLRRDALQNALREGDFKSVKYGISLFKKEVGWDKPKDPDKDPPSKKKDPPIEPGEDFTNDGSLVKPQKEYTMAEVEKFYLDQTKGKWVGRETEASAIDRDIQLAQQQGRIKG